MDAEHAADRAIVRTLAMGAAPEAVIEEVSAAIRALCPGRGAAVWYRRENGTATVHAAGVDAHLAMITTDADSAFWDRACAVRQPNYNITFRADPEDAESTSVWCLPAPDGPVAGELVIVVLGEDGGSPPEGDVTVELEHLTRLMALSVDRKRLLERLERNPDDPGSPGPQIEMGLTAPSGSAGEPAETVVLSVGLEEIVHVENQHGRPAADALAEEIGHRLVGIVRNSDTIARVNHTDFALRCHGLSAIQAESVATRVLNDLWMPVVTRWETARLRPRIGIARATEPTPLSQLLHDADLAQHEADRVGRDWLWRDDLSEPSTQSEPGRLADSASGSPA